MNCAIVDDEPLAVELLASYAKKTPFLNLVGTFSSAVTAFNALRSTTSPHIDLLFLDIQMPELDGLEFAKLVKSDTKIVFTTAFSQYGVEGFRANALDYLLKPVSYADFVMAATKALRWFEESGGAARSAGVVQDDELALDIIYVKADYKYVQIKLSDVLYIEGLKDYLKIYLEGKPKPILTLVSMKKMADRLPSPRFMRVHRSFIVQVSKIKMLERGHIVFGKTAIPISEAYREQVQAILDKKTL